MKETINDDIQSGRAKIESQMGSIIENASVKPSDKGEKIDSKNEEKQLGAGPSEKPSEQMGSAIENKSVFESQLDSKKQSDNRSASVKPIGRESMVTTQIDMFAKKGARITLADLNRSSQQSSRLHNSKLTRQSALRNTKLEEKPKGILVTRKPHTIKKVNLDPKHFPFD